MKTLKKPVSILLSLLMVLSLFSVVPFTAFAAGEGTYDLDGEGKLILHAGTFTDPYREFEAEDGIISVYAEPGVVLSGDCHEMFSWCLYVKSIDLSNADMSGVTSVEKMFEQCYQCETIKLPKSNVFLGTSTAGMFYNCNQLEELDLSGCDTSSVLSMSEMFSHCRSIKNLDLTSFNTSSVKNMQKMFYDCTALENVDLSTFDTKKVNNMESMFSDCSSIKTLDLSSFDTSMVGTFDYMFCNTSEGNDYQLTTIYVSDKWNVQYPDGSYASGSFMFRNCFNIQGGQGTRYYWNSEDPQPGVGIKRAHIDGGVSDPGYLTRLDKVTVRWKNYDGSILKTERISKGSTASYSGDTPVKPDTAEYKYTFSGWSPEPGVVEQNTEYTAQYTETKRSYTITWKNDDGSVIDTTTVPYGEIPTYEDPTKPDDGNIVYTFAGWEPAPSEVTGDAAYTATYTEEEKTDWAKLQTSILGAPDGEETTITLTKDCAAGESDTALIIPATKIITLDLGEYTLDRGLTDESAQTGGNIITNNGELTITGSGTLKGGNHSDRGGAIVNNGTLTVAGGTITGNHSTQDGGAVYNSGTLNISGGSFESNSSDKSGGAISAHSGTITINGGEIKNNRAGSHGGAIYLGNKDGNIATLNLRGGTITGNTVTGSDSQGGGICDVGTLNVSGNPVVKNNTAPAYNKGHNIYLRNGKKVNVTGELTDGAEIGVTAPGGGTGVFTSGLSGNGTADSFFSDNPDYYVDVNGSGEGTLASYYVFSFDANGGTGEQETIRRKTNEIELPDCTFTAPEGKGFMAWNVGGAEKQPGETVTITSGYTMTAAAVWADAYHIEIEDDIVNGTVSADAEYAAEGQTVTLTVAPDEGYVLQELYVMPTGSDPTILNPEAPDFSFTMPAQNVIIHACFAKGTAYVDAKGNDMPAKIALELVSSDAYWGVSVHAGETTSWYYAEGEVTISDRVTVTGNVNLILCDGATLTIPKGIHVARGTGLTIWQQKGGTGHLVIDSVAEGKAAIGSDRIGSGTTSTKTAGTITINGGILDVRGGTYAAGIGGGDGCSGGTITINGGTVNATSGFYGAAIGGGRSGKAGSVTINGGNVNATANWYGAAIGQGSDATYSQTDTVTINGGNVKAIMTSEPNATSSFSVMNGSTFTLNYTDESKNTMSVMAESWSGAVTVSKKFVDENGNIYGVGNISDSSTLNGKTLRPYDGMGVQLAGHSISLDGDVAVNFYMQLDPEITAHEGVKMQFTVPDTSAEYQYQEIEVSDDIKDGEYYVFKCRVAAKNMDSVISAQLVDGDNKSIIYTYSVKDYADYLLAHLDVPKYAAAENLVRAMLVYGDNAKYYFGGDTEPDQINTEIPEYPSTVASFADSLFDGATLSLKSQTTLSLYFKSDDPITLSIDGKTEGVDYELKSAGNEYVIRIRNIAIKDLNKNITVKVNGQDAVTYSPLTYCYKAQNSSDTKLANTVKALYLYWQAADEYFD